MNRKIALQDARAFLRHQVRRKGKIVFFKGPHSIDCTLIDLSEDGARISTEQFLPLVHTFLLHDEKGGALLECVVRWRTRRLTGFQFVDVSDRTARREQLEESFRALAREDGSASMH